MGIKTFTLRLTEEQLDYVNEKAKELGISKNDYIRRLIDEDEETDGERYQYTEIEIRILHEISELKDILTNPKK